MNTDVSISARIDTAVTTDPSPQWGKVVSRVVFHEFEVIPFTRRSPADQTGSVVSELAGATSVMLRT
jgi:hypothetical protein